MENRAVRAEHFESFVGSHLPTLVGDPWSVIQLASQQPVSSAVHQAFLQLKQQRHSACNNVADWLNRPRALSPLVLSLEHGPSIGAKISTCAVSPAADYIAVGDTNGFVTLLSLREKGRIVHRLYHRPQNPDSTDDVCTDQTRNVSRLGFFTADGDGGSAERHDGDESALYLASAADIVVRFWRVSDGEEVGCLSGHTYVTNPGGGCDGVAPQGPCQCKHYLLDGKYSRLRSGYCFEPGHCSTLTAMAVASKHDLVATACALCIKVWSLSRKAELHTLYGHTDDITDLCFNDEATRLFSAGEDRLVLVWNIPRGGTAGEGVKLVGHIYLPHAVSALALSPPAVRAGDPAATAGSPPGQDIATITTPMMTSNAVLAVHGQEHVRPCVEAAFVDTVSAVFTKYHAGGAGVGGEGAKSIQDLVGRETWRRLSLTKKLSTFLRSYGAREVAEAFHLVKTTGAGKTEQARPSDLTEHFDLRIEGEVVEIIQKSGGSASVPGGVVAVVPASSVTEKFLVRTHVTHGEGKEGPPPCICKSDWGELVPNPACRVRGHAGRIHSVCFVASPHGPLLVSCGSGEVLACDADSGRPMALLKKPHAGAKAAGAACGGGALITWSQRLIKVWDLLSVVEAGCATATAGDTGHAGAVTGLKTVCASAAEGSGRVVLSSSEDSTAGVWRIDEASSSSLADLRLTGHRRAVRCCALSPDGRLAATGGGDRCVRIFDVSTGELVQELPHPGSRSDNGVVAVAFEPSARPCARCEPGAPGTPVHANGQTRSSGGVQQGYRLASASGEGACLAFWRIAPTRPALSMDASRAHGVDGVSDALLCRLQALVQTKGVVHLAENFGSCVSEQQTFSQDPYPAELRDAFRVDVVCLGGDVASGERSEGAAFTERMIVVTCRATGERVASAPHPLLLAIPGHDSSAASCTCAWARRAADESDDEDSPGVRSRSQRCGKIWGSCPMPGHSWDIEQILYRADGQVLVTTSRDETIRVWRGADGACVRTIELFSQCSRPSVCFSPCGKFLCVGSDESASSSNPLALSVWRLLPRAADDARLQPSHSHIRTPLRPVGIEDIKPLQVRMPDLAMVSAVTWSGSTLAAATFPAAGSARQESAIRLFAAEQVGDGDDRVCLEAPLVGL